MSHPAKENKTGWRRRDREWAPNEDCRIQLRILPPSPSAPPYTLPLLVSSRPGEAEEGRIRTHPNRPQTCPRTYARAHKSPRTDEEEGEDEDDDE